MVRITHPSHSQPFPWDDLHPLRGATTKMINTLKFSPLEEQFGSAYMKRKNVIKRRNQFWIRKGEIFDGRFIVFWVEPKCRRGR